MEPEKIWQQFTALPLEARREVADFIALLHERDRPPKPSQSAFCNLARAGGRKFL